MLGDVDVVAVCDIRLIRDARDDAEAALEALCELVRGALERRAVQTETDGGLCLPFFARSVHVLHDSERKRRCAGVRVGFARHVAHALAQTGIAERNGGIAAVEKRIDGLAFFEAGDCAVLPEDWRGVGQSALQAVVAAHECAIAQVEALIEDLPEFFHIAAGAERDIDKIQCDDALIEAAVELIVAVFILPRA